MYRKLKNTGRSQQSDKIKYSGALGNGTQYSVYILEYLQHLIETVDFSLNCSLSVVLLARFCFVLCRSKVTITSDVKSTVLHGSSPDVFVKENITKKCTERTKSSVKRLKVPIPKSGIQRKLNVL
jgi:hypothetical protein